MTRFARAHGSKSSNEKLPEQATSWNVMKRQLQEKLQQSNESITNANKLVQKVWKSSDFEPDAWNKNNTVWVELEESSQSGSRSDKTSQQITLKTKKGKKKKNTVNLNQSLPNSEDSLKKSKKRKLKGQDIPRDDSCNFSDHDDKQLNIINITNCKKNKKFKKCVNLEDCDYTQAVSSETGKISHGENSTKKHKSRKKLESCNLTENEMLLQEIRENISKESGGRKRKREDNSILEIVQGEPASKHQLKSFKNENKFESSGYTKPDNIKKLDGKKKKFTEREHNIDHTASTFQVLEPTSEKEIELNKEIDSNIQPLKKKKKQKNLENSCQAINNASPKKEKNSQDVKNKTSHLKIEKKEKRPKWQQKNDKIKKKLNFLGKDKIRRKHENRKKYEHITILHMNGKDIEIVKFDGFPVKREDAENLRILKQKLIANGVSQSEIKHTMKLERRKAEKALAREKKKVCFHCRKSGHVLSECPELGKAEMEDASGTGICFKCGSTEHKHFECRVTREQEFRFAKCFICNEQGHIARQCPDNPRGLYPKGGGCHVCGDVTHLKKDCPDLIKEKEQKTIRLPTLSGKSLEVLEEDIKNAVIEPVKQSKKKKTVMFKQ